METCPACGHEAHSVGDRECEEVVQHGPKRWHRCLCLNKPGADKTCPPLMDCQGGPLGYADIYHLQRGITVHGVQGKIYTPAFLTGDGSRRVGYRSRTSPTMLRCLVHAPEDNSSGWDWHPVTVSDVQASLLRQTCSYPHCGVNVLEVTPCPGTTCFHAVDEHSVYGCAEGCGCTWMPRKTGPCSDPPCGYEKGELCDTHHTKKAHAEGDHQWCDITCQDEFTWEMLRNGVLWQAAPGSTAMLDELLRRAADRSALMEAHIALVSTASQLRTLLGAVTEDRNELAHRLEGLEK